MTAADWDVMRVEGTDPATFLRVVATTGFVGMGHAALNSALSYWSRFITNDAQIQFFMNHECMFLNI